MGGFVVTLHDEPSPLNGFELENIHEKLDVLAHRGPDDSGFYFDTYIQMGYRRLRIKDEYTDFQPLNFGNGRYWIVFNGKIYNYKELRAELQDEELPFEAESEQEVLLALYIKMKEKMLQKIRGMYAFLIWDREERTLFGARDPFGMKPLYYLVEDEKVCFSSEPKGILGLEKDRKMDLQALNHYFSFQFVPEPRTLVENLHKLLPGHYFLKKPGKPMQIAKFWQATFHTILQTEDEWVQQIREVLSYSVQHHVENNQPVGAFLSGGIDSTLILSLAKRFHSDIKTFSVGFFEDGYSELSVAALTAKKLGVEHIAISVSPEEFIEALPKIVWYMDDPLADPSIVPLYFLAREARNHVRVVLSGEGADELFGGYPIYREPHSLRMFKYMPSMLIKLLCRLAKIWPNGWKGKSFLERGTTPLEERYIGNAKIFEDEEKRQFFTAKIPVSSYREITKAFYIEAKQYGPVEKMQYVDFHTWLRGDILLKADRMTMAHSLELRLPFLDLGVFRVASRIPASLKIAKGTTKFILRKAAAGIVPEHVISRKKLGFPVPIRLWLKDELYDWAKNLILESETEEYLHKKYFLELLEKHRVGEGDFSRNIWTALMFFLWHGVFVEKKYEILREESPSRWISEKDKREDF